VPKDPQYFPEPLKMTGDITDLQSVTVGDKTTITLKIKKFSNEEPLKGIIAFTSNAGLKTGVIMTVQPACPSKPPK
jgi:hypothetical protein